MFDNWYNSGEDLHTAIDDHGVCGQATLRPFEGGWIHTGHLKWAGVSICLSSDPGAVFGSVEAAQAALLSTIDEKLSEAEARIAAIRKWRETL